MSSVWRAEPITRCNCASAASPSDSNRTTACGRAPATPSAAKSRVAHSGASAAHGPAGAGWRGVAGRTTLRVPKTRNSGSPRYGKAAIPITQASAAYGCRRWRRTRVTTR